MDEDLTFPNPVLRSDLPIKRRWRLRLLTAAGVLLILCTLFLPQILHSRIGRRLLRARLESKYNAEVTIADISTHWTGGTTVSQFWIKGVDGRVIGFSQFSGDVSLWQLLRGNYALGNCSIDGLIVDYVLDSGDSLHRDTYEQLTGAAPMAAGATPPLARLSGKITLTNAQVTLSRGITDPLTLSTRFQTVRFTGLDGACDIAALDHPWTYRLGGDVGLSEEERGQTFTSSGTICLGAGGKFVPNAVKVDVVVAAQYVPTDLLPILAPILSVEDCRRCFGATFDRLNLAIKGDGGVLHCEHFEAGGATTQFNLRPTFDLNTTPATLSMSGPQNVLTAAMPPPGAIKRALQCVNPLLLESTGEGTIVLRITDLNVPMSKSWMLGSGKGILELHDVRLASPHEPLLGDLPRGLLNQLALLSGDINPAPLLDAAPESFSFDNGLFTVTPTTVKAGDAHLILSGSSSAEGLLRMKIGVSSSSLTAAIPELPGSTGLTIQVNIGGTVGAPVMDLDALRRSLPFSSSERLDDWMKKQLTALRSREAELSRRDQERKVRDMMKDFGPAPPEKKP